MNRIQCPYCEIEMSFDHDGEYEEDELHEIECISCGKYFVYTVSISVEFYPGKADCLNDGLHKWESTHTYPIEFTRMKCAACGQTRACTNEEMSAEIKRRG